MCREMWSLQNLRVVCRGSCVSSIYPHATDVRVDRYFWEIGADVFRKGFVSCGCVSERVRLLRKGGRVLRKGSLFGKFVLEKGRMHRDTCAPLLRKGFGPVPERGSERVRFRRIMRNKKKMKIIIGRMVRKLLRIMRKGNGY
jgi:hypothetical protein